MYRYFTPLPLLLLSVCLSAQTYDFAVSTQAYSELDGGVLLNTDSITGEPVVWDDEPYFIPLGFTLSLFEKSIDTLVWAGNAFIADQDPNIPTAKGDEIQLISGYLSDVVDRGYIASQPSQSPVTYHLTGSSPNAIGIIQFKNAGFYDESSDDGVSDYFTNFQIWIYESGTIEFRYGPTSPEILDGTEDAEFGVVLLKDYYYDDRDDSEGFTEGYHLAGDPENPVYTSLTSQDLEDYDLYLDGVPPSGTVYTFTVSGTSGLFSPEEAIGALNIFPNPATDRVSLSLPADLKGRLNRLEIFDGAGRRVRDLAPVPAFVELGDLPVGLYHLRMTTDAGRTLVGRVAKR